MIAVVPDLNDTQFVEAVRAKVGPDAVILAANDPLVHGVFELREDREPVVVRELTERFLTANTIPAPSRRGRRFAGGIYASRNFHKLPRSR